MLGLSTQWIGKAALDLKLLKAEPAILANNRALVTAMLEAAKPSVYAATPVGPGHFGYHGRDTLKVDVTSKGVKTEGVLTGAIQLYWREYGTRARFRRTKATKYSPGKMLLTAGESSLAGALGGGGERAYMTAHKALGDVKRYISFYYGGMARWWKS